MRGGPRQFTYSKLMTWVAFDRGVKSHEEFGRGDHPRAERIHPADMSPIQPLERPTVARRGQGHVGVTRRYLRKGCQLLNGRYGCHASGLIVRDARRFECRVVGYRVSGDPDRPKPETRNPTT